MSAYRLQANLFLPALLACFAAPLWSQSAGAAGSLLELDRFSNSVQALAAKVSPSVVRITVTGFSHAEENGRTGWTMDHQQTVGSGVIIDSDGYIVTNAHVVEGAQRIRVNLVRHGEQTIASAISQSYAAPQNATLLGTFREGDLALLKIDGSGYPALPLADYGKLRQGQVVLAFGSPSGMQDSVSMGIVSSVARQPDVDSPLIYIQTDTPINPGNSGGPLVNTAGEIVGLNTFILSRSGGNEGVGFAVPSMLLHWVVPQLRKYGHVHRSTTGMGLQSITSVLASALKLPRTSGVVISDVRPGSPAELAGIKVDDILLTLDGRPVDSVPSVMGSFFQHGNGDHLKVRVLLGTEEMTVDVLPVEERHDADRLTDLADPDRDLIADLGIVGVSVTKQVEAISGPLRLPTGVIVTARVQNSSAPDSGLQPGDVLHSINGKFIFDVSTLKSALAELKPTEPVAVLIERASQLSYVAFELP